MAEVKVCTVADCPPGTMKAVEANGKVLLLANVNGTFYCCENSCTHHGAPLSDGELQGLIVTCPWHGAQYDVSSGKVLSPPAPDDLRKYTVKVVGADVVVEL